jgi:RimJ/RimL family protein N-acetyltransferase
MTAAAPEEKWVVSIRPAEWCDVEKIQALARDPRIAATSNVPAPLPDDYAVERLDPAELRRSGEKIFTILVGGEIVGLTALEPVGSQTFLSFWIGPLWWNRGIARRAARLTVEFAQERLNLRLLRAVVLQENVASRRVLERTGFTFCRVLNNPGQFGARFIGREFCEYRWFSPGDEPRESHSSSCHTVGIRVAECVNMYLEEILREFGAAHGIADLALDRYGVCRLLFDSNLAVDIEPAMESGRVYFYTIVTQLPDSNREEFLLELLGCNLYGRETGPAALGWDASDGQIILSQILELDRLVDLTVFEQQVFAFVRNARLLGQRFDNWDGRLETANRETGEALPTTQVQLTDTVGIRI